MNVRSQFPTGRLGHCVVVLVPRIAAVFRIPLTSTFHLDKEPPSRQLRSFISTDVIPQLGSLIPCTKHLVTNNGTDLSECLALSLRKSFLHVDAISPYRSSLRPTLRERSFLIKTLNESRTVYQRLADGTSRKRSVEDRSEEKNCAQHSHDDGETMQAVVGCMLTVDEAKKTGRSDRADISRRTL